MRSGDGAGGPTQQLTNEAGEVTSHLQGLWYRTLRFIEAGIKPVYVFDGKPPTLKGGELAKRVKLKEKAHADLAAAKEAGNAEDVERFQRRTVRMGKEHVDDCKKLLRLMGMPVVEAPCEAEAQCAALARADKVYAAASEDMDTLTFGAPRLVRRLWASDAKKNPILEINLAKACAGATAGGGVASRACDGNAPPPIYTLHAAASGMEVTMDQFVDVCILAGCDYCEGIKGACSDSNTTAVQLHRQRGAPFTPLHLHPRPLPGIAAVSALKLVKSDKSLAGVLRGLDREKHPVPAGVDYDEVRGGGGRVLLRRHCGPPQTPPPPPGARPVHEPRRHGPRAHRPQVDGLRRGGHRAVPRHGEGLRCAAHSCGHREAQEVARLRAAVANGLVLQGHARAVASGRRWRRRGQAQGHGVAQEERRQARQGRGWRQGQGGQGQQGAVAGTRGRLAARGSHHAHSPL